jgi:YbbR domain-containing protein
MKDFVRKWILNRWQYKLAAFVTAFFLWFYVVSEQNLSININIPIEFTNFPSDMHITNKVRTSVDITLEGRRDLVNQIEKKGIKALVDLKNAKDGRNDYVITAAQIISMPRGLIIKNISPTGITIEFEKVQQAPAGNNGNEKKEQKGKG